MRIVEYRELPDSAGADLASMNTLDGDPPQGRDFVERFRKAGFPVAPYFGLYALEGGRLQAKVEVLNLRLATPSGSTRVVGVADVATRPEAQRRGYASALLKALHRRAAADGRSWAFLWTRQSWGAHRLYERLGYRDLYSPPVALRPVPRHPRVPMRSGYRWRRARAADLPALEALLRGSTRGRWGFVPRFPRSMQARSRFGWVNPDDLGILWEGRSRVGYAWISRGNWARVVQEAVVVSPHHANALIDALRREAAGGWLCLTTTTFVADHRRRLEELGFDIVPSTFRTLMGRRLGRTGPRPEEVSGLFRDPRLSNHRGDTF